MTIHIKERKLRTEAEAQGFLENLADVIGSHDFSRDETGEEEDFR